MPILSDSRSTSRFWLIIAVFWINAIGISFATAQVTSSNTERVIIVSIDGLRSDVIQNGNASSLPGFYRLMDEAAFTLNARVDPDRSVTLPNHVSMVTGRHLSGQEGHEWGNNALPSPFRTIHQEKGSYVASLFDVAHDRGMRTALFTSKSKFSLFDRSYDAGNGAPDTVGPDNGRDKIDTFELEPSSTLLLDAFKKQTQAFDLAFLHFSDTDIAGHGLGFSGDMSSGYSYAVRFADHMIWDLMEFVNASIEYAGRTTIIISSDHGGDGPGHSNPLITSTFTVPFFVWGPDADAGSDLYALNGARVNPGSSHVSLQAAAQSPPIFNADLTNLALDLLSLPAVPGSSINNLQDLVVNSDVVNPPAASAPTASFSITVSSSDPLQITADASASTDPDGTIESYAWQMGDGTNMSGPVASHTYISPGTYQVRLTVQDNDTLVNSAQKSVSVSDISSEFTLSFQDSLFPSSAYSGTSDTKLRSDDPDTAFGSDPTLEMDAFPEYHGMIRWDLSSIPETARIVSASITVDIINVTFFQYGFYPMLRPWSEESATWNESSTGSAWNQPGASGALDHDNVLMASILGPELGEKTVGLSAAGIQVLQDWVQNPANNHGYLIELLSGSDDGIDFSSSEASQPTKRPKLTVTYTMGVSVPSNSPPDASFVMTPETGSAPLDVILDASGSSDFDGSIVSFAWSFGDGQSAIGVSVAHAFTEAGLYAIELVVTDDEGASTSSQQLLSVQGAAMASLSFQDGVSPTSSYQGTRDTKLLSDDPNSNFGNALEIEVDGAPDYAGLLKWDLSLIPSGSILLSADIHLNITDPSFDSYEMYEVTQDWDESSATWLQASTGTNWGGAGASGIADRGNIILGRVNTSNTGIQTFSLNGSGVDLVQKWIDDSSTNKGVVIQDFSAANDGIDFSSRSAAQGTRRPRLSVEYTTAPISGSISSVSSDTGQEIQFSPIMADLSIQSGELAALEHLFGTYASLMQVQGMRLARRSEIRVDVLRNTTALLLVPTADSSLVNAGPGGFDRLTSSTYLDTNRLVYAQTLSRGIRLIEVPAGARLFIADPTAAIATGLDVGFGALEGDEVPTGPTLFAFPNPFGTRLEVDLKASGRGRIRLINMLGQTVLSSQIEQSRLQLDTSEIAAGTYVLHVEMEDGRAESVMITKAR